MAAVAFASPSAVKAVVAGLGERAALLRGVVLAAIGPTTAEALRAAGLAPAVQPARYTGADLADAIAARLGRRGDPAGVVGARASPERETRAVPRRSRRGPARARVDSRRG